MNIAASLVDKSLDGTWVSLFVMFAPNLKLHHLLYAGITKIHKISFSLWVWFRFHIVRWSAFNQFFVSWCSAVTLLNWGRKWKTKVSSAGASSPFLPLCILEISSFALKNKPVPVTTRLDYCYVKHDYFSPYIKQNNSVVIFRCGFSALNL